MTALEQMAALRAMMGEPAEIDSLQWDGLLLTYRHRCAKLVIAPPVNGENGGVHYED